VVRCGCSGGGIIRVYYQFLCSLKRVEFHHPGGGYVGHVTQHSTLRQTPHSVRPLAQASTISRKNTSVDEGKALLSTHFPAARMEHTVALTSKLPIDPPSIKLE